MYELFIAMRHITSRRRQTILSVFAVGIAVMVLMVSQALIVGFTQEFYKKTVDNIPHITIEPESDDDYIYFYQNQIDKLKDIDGVTGVSPVLGGQATFRHKGSSKNVIMQGILVREQDSVLNINEDIIAGSFKDLEVTGNSVVLGDKLADTLDVEIGDQLDASFPEIKPVTLKVVGIFDSGTPLDENLAYTTLSTAQDFFDVSNVVNSIIVRVDDPDKADIISHKIDSMGYPASSWKETNPEILQTIRIESFGNYITMGLIVVIASFGIVSTLSMVVMEKTYEIGMLMAMGASRRSIQKIFIMESGILGLLGAVLGVAAGILISSISGPYVFDVGEKAYAGISSIPFIVRTQDAVAIIVFTFLLNLFAGIYPARRASKLDPVEAIRSE